jgi:two-component system, NtrC family, response regulator PilR
MYKRFWKFLNRTKQKSPRATPANEASTPSPTRDAEVKELLGSWVYDNLKGVGVVITDLNETIKHFNAEAQVLTSIPGDAAKGKQLTAMFPSLSYKLQAQLEEKKFLRKEFPFTDSKRKQKCFKWTLGPLNDPLKGSIGFVSVFEDITEQKELQQKLRLEEDLRTAKERVLVEEQRGLIGEEFKFKELIGQSQEMTNICRLIQKVAPTNTTILIMGETGTGKETVARAIHSNSLRRDKPFVVVNCGAILESLIEDELFGHVVGAFTGAVSDRPGLIKEADRGTIFLDEIGELPLHLQAKLARVLEEKAVIAVGGNKRITVDVRVIAGSNKDLKSDMESGHFRNDLFYRLNVVRIKLPALRNRKEDIPLLAHHFVKKFAPVHKKQVEEISRGAMMCLMNYDYAGNIWELENIVEHAVAVTNTSVLTEEHLPPDVQGLLISEEKIELFEKTAPGVEIALLNKPVSIDDELATREKCLLLAALKKSRGAQKRAAELLGINYRSFRHRLEKYGLIDKGL